MRSLLSRLVEAAYPDAGRNGTAATEPVRSLHLIGLLRTLIDYGRQLIITARQCAGTPDFLAFARPLGTTSLKLLIARIGCAISRAAQLERKLAREACLGAQPQPPPARRAPRARPSSPTVRPLLRTADPDSDPELAGLPSVEQIAAEIRHRPMPEVIATICRDLGITQDHKLWREIDHALAAFGLRLPAPVESHDPPRPGAAASTAAARPAALAGRARVQSPHCTGPPIPTDASIAA